jgi:hypothetical protein
MCVYYYFRVITQNLNEILQHFTIEIICILQIVDMMNLFINISKILDDKIYFEMFTFQAESPNVYIILCIH